MGRASQLRHQLQHSPLPRDRQLAARAAAELDRPEAVGILLSGLNDPNPNVRMVVVEALGRHTEDQRAAQAIHAALSDPEPSVRATVVEALGRVGDRRAAVALLAARSDDSQWVHTEAARALASLGARAVEPLLDAMRHPSSAIRANAAKVLGELRDPRAIKPLKAALHDTELGVRLMATEALLEFGVEPPIRALIEASEHHPSPFVQSQAKRKVAWSKIAAAPKASRISSATARVTPGGTGGQRANRWTPKVVIAALAGALVAGILLAPPSRPTPTVAPGTRPSNDAAIPIAETTTTAPPRTAKPTTTKPPTTKPTTTTRPNGSNPNCEFDLAEAIVEEYVNVVFEGRGSSSGDSVDGKVRNKTRRTLYLRVRSGIFLKSRNPGAQDMIVQGLSPGESNYPPEEREYPRMGCIELSPGAVFTFILRAYCEDFDLANPAASDHFSIPGRVRGELRRLFTTLGEVPEDSPSIEAVQVAVWVLTDNIARWQLDRSFPVLEDDVRAARNLLQRARIRTSNRRLFQ
jgi:hypothetical protein